VTKARSALKRKGHNLLTKHRWEMNTILDIAPVWLSKSCYEAK